MGNKRARFSGGIGEKNMLIYVDNIMLNVELHKKDTLEKIIKSVERLIIDHGRVLTHIMADGKDIPFFLIHQEENIKEAITHLEFFTSSPEVVLLENIRVLHELLAEGRIHFEEALYFLENGLYKRGYKKILGELEKIEMVAETFDAVSTLSHTMQQSTTFHEMITEFNQAIERLLYFLKAEDIYHLTQTIKQDLLAVAKIIEEQVDKMYYTVLGDFIEERGKNNC